MLIGAKAPRGLGCNQTKKGAGRMHSLPPRWIKLAYPAALLAMLAAAVVAAHLITPEGLDLSIYREGISAWQAGKNPYLLHFTDGLSFTYPPVALLALEPLTWLPFAWALGVLWFLTVALLAVVIDLASRHSGRAGGPAFRLRALGWATLATLVVEPVRSTMDFGQINVLLMLLVTVDLLGVPRRHRGWLIGLAAAIKLTPAIFLLIPLLERDWKSVGRGALGAGATTGLMAVISPGASSQYWFHDLFNPRRVGGISYEGNQSWYGLLHRFPFSVNGNEPLYVLLAALTLAAAVVVARHCLGQGQRVQAMMAVALCGLLISPISWTHHWVWVTLIPIVIFAPRHNLSMTVRAGLGVVLVTAILAPYWWWKHGGDLSLRAATLTVFAFVALVIWAVAAVRTPGAPAKEPAELTPV